MTTETETPEETTKVERLKQNGVTQPAEGTKTRMIWDKADELSAEHGRPALADEVHEALGDDFVKATVSTQYNAWCKFYGVTSEQRKEARAARKAAEAPETETEEA